MKTSKILISIVAAACTAISAVACSGSSKSEAENAEAAEAIAADAVADNVKALDSNIKAVSAPADDQSIRPGMKPAKLTIIDFNATWCPPCRMFGPTFENAAEAYEGKADFYSIDTDNFPQTAQAFRISSIPTIVFIEPDGKMTQHVGLGDFFKGINNLDAASDEEIVNAMDTNFKAMIAEKLK